MNQTDYAFSTSLVMPWVKGNVSIDHRQIQVCTSNIILGCIPAGQNRQMIPLSNVSSASIHTGYKVMPMLIGIIIGFIALAALFSGEILGFLIFGVVAVLLVGSGMLTTLVIGRGGSNYRISVPFYEKTKIATIEEAINNALNYTEDKRDNNRVIEDARNNTDRLVEAFNRTQQLAD